MNGRSPRPRGGDPLQESEADHGVTLERGRLKGEETGATVVKFCAGVWPWHTVGKWTARWAARQGASQRSAAGPCHMRLCRDPWQLILLFRAYRVSDGAESETRKGQLNKFSKQQPRLDVWSADVGAGSTVRVCVLGNR